MCSLSPKVLPPAGGGASIMAAGPCPATAAPYVLALRLPVHQAIHLTRRIGSATPWRPLRRRENRSDAADAAAAGPLSAGPRAAARVASEKNAAEQSVDAATQQAAEDEAPKKKPRLGWGQGLAKYEKRQTPGCADPAKPSADGSPDGVEQKVDVGAGVPASAPCASPVAPAPPAPSSAPPYSSPVPEDKSCELMENIVTLSNKYNTGAEAQAYNEEIPLKLGFSLGTDVFFRRAHYLPAAVPCDTPAQSDALEHQPLQLHDG